MHSLVIEGLRCPTFSLSFAPPVLPPGWHDVSTLIVGDRRDAFVAGAFGGLPLTGGEPAIDVFTERALLCGEVAEVHLKDLALV